MGKKRYLSAGEVAAALGISVPTVYAYVSRGLLRSEAADETGRQRRYRVADVEALKARQELRRNPARVVESALHFGAPLLESAITLIADGRFYYRGHDVMELARNASIEEVAALIWTGSLAVEALFSPGPDGLENEYRRYHALAPHLSDLPPMEAFQVALPLAAAEDLAAYDLAAPAVAQTGARILRLLTAVAAGRPLDGNIAGQLQVAWSPDEPEATALFNAALVLCADHELNVSSFTARCIASAGSTPYAVVMGGLAALQGPKHGGHTERIEALFREATTSADVRATITSHLKRGEGVPGFGHVLYPEGDPRARMLLDWLSTVYAGNPAVDLADAIVNAASHHVGVHPNLDFGLVTLTRALDLPPGSALALFALGRTVGWIGHAIEQYRVDRMIRPRARYTGEQPRR